jgi:outer membrane protein OmpA-like peptidoglycan-associated protein
VFFETGQYALLPESEYELGKVVELLRQNPRLKVEIGGHTDNVGKPADNQRLSEQRAKAVRDYLISKGIAESSLTYKGYGESKPVASNDSEQGRAQNRRTEMKIIGN